MIDVAAFTELYRGIYKDLYRFALCTMQHSQDAEDAVSEAVLSAYENVHKLKKDGAFRSWIFTILANVCKKKLIERSKTQTEVLDECPDVGVEDKTGLGTEVRDAFFVLGEEERLIISLSVFGGYNSKEIGDMLHLNPNTVRSKRSRALEKMSVILKE